MRDEVALAKKMRADHRALRERLLARGYEIVGEFNCAGFNTNSFLKYFGGLNKGRPNACDIAEAKAFGHKLLASLTPYVEPRRGRIKEVISDL